MNLRRLWVTSLLAFICALLTPAAQAQVNAAASMTGSLSAATFSATLVPDGAFVNNGSKFWLAWIDASGQGYFHSGAQGGWVPYRGGVAPAYGDITAPSMSVGFTQWDVSGAVGSQIYIAYGSSFEEMLSSGRFLLIHTVQAPAADPMAAYNGSYTCYNQYYLTGRVNVNLTSSRAIVDTTDLYSIPVNTVDVPFSKIETDGKIRLYSNASLPVKQVRFDPTPGVTYPMTVGYASSSYNIVVWACKR